MYFSRSGIQFLEEFTITRNSKIHQCLLILNKSLALLRMYTIENYLEAWSIHLNFKYNFRWSKYVMRHQMDSFFGKNIDKTWKPCVSSKVTLSRRICSTMSDHFRNLVVYCYFYAKYKLIVLSVQNLWYWLLLSTNLSYMKLPVKIIIDTIHAIYFSLKHCKSYICFRHQIDYTQITVKEQKYFSYWSAQ